MPADRRAVTVQAWTLESERLLFSETLPIQLDTFSGIHLSADGELVAVGYENGTAELWGVHTGRRPATLSGHNDWVWSVLFDRDDRRLATLSSDGQVRIWDVQASLDAGAGRQPASFTVLADHGRPQALAFVGDTHVAVGTHLGYVELWDLADSSGPIFSRLGHANVVHHLSLDPDQTRLVSGNEDGIAKTWDLTNGELLLTLDGSFDSVYRARFSADGNLLVTLGQDGGARVWDVRLLALGERGSFTTSPLTFDVELSPDGQLLATGSEVEGPSLWDPLTGELVRKLEGAEGGVFRVAFSPDGERLAGGGRDSQIHVWDVASGQKLMTIPAHGPGTIAEGLIWGTTDVAYSPDGSRLASAGADGVAKVWDAQTGEELLAFANHTAGLHNLAYSPDGRLIATSSYRDDATVRVWDAQTGQEHFVLHGHEGDIWGLTFSPDSSRLVSGGDYGIVIVWNMVTGEELYSLPGLTGAIFDIVFTPDGQHFITTEDALRVWRTSDGVEVLNLYDQLTYWVTVSSDGRYAYVVDIQDTTQILMLHLEDTLSLANERLTRWWRLEECQRYLHKAECPSRLP